MSPTDSIVKPRETIGRLRRAHALITLALNTDDRFNAQQKADLHAANRRLSYVLYPSMARREVE